MMLMFWAFNAIHYKKIKHYDLFYCWNLNIKSCFVFSVKPAVPDDGSPPGAPVLTKLLEWCRFGVGENWFCVVLVLSSETNIEHFAKTSRNIYARASITPPKHENRASKVGGFAATFAYRSFESRRGGSCSRIVCF